MELPTIKEKLASIEVFVFSLSVLFCTIPLQMMTKMASSGLIPSFEGVKFTSFEILPLYAVGQVLTNALFFTFSGWWKWIPVKKRFGIILPRIRWYIFVSGICTVGQIFSAIWAYTFTGVSIVFVSLLMKGGILIMAPVIDSIAKKRKRNIFWPSWVAAALSLCAIIIASVGKANANMTLVCFFDILIYLGVHCIKLSIMSRWAKSQDKRERKQYIIEEQIVISIVLTVALAIMGAMGAHIENYSALREIWRGYTALPAMGFVVIPLLIGVFAVGMGIFQSLICLDRRENTFCVTIVQSSGIISGTIVTTLLSVLYNQPKIGVNNVISVSIVIGAIFFLAYRGVVERRLLNGRKISENNPAGGAVGMREEPVR